MTTPAWMDSSLRSSSRLGLEVLERARARRVHWPRAAGPPSKDGRGGSSCAHLRPSGGEQQVEQWRGGGSVSHTFDAVMELMARTTDQCEKLYASEPPHEPNKQEAKHICRYHPKTSDRMGRVRHVERPRTPEDFLIEVPPGTYTVTADAEDAGWQSQLVCVGAGESVKLTFRLSPLHGPVLHHQQ